MTTERLRVTAFWAVFATVTTLTLVWLTVGALVTTPLNEPPGQAVVDYLASAVNLVVAVVLLRFGGRSWSGRLLALAMVGSAGAFNLQAHSATMAVRDTTGIEIGEAHQILLHGVAGAAFAGALLLVPAEIAGSPLRRRVVPVVAGVVLFAAGVGTALLPHTVSCVVFFGFLVPLLGVGAIAPAARRAPTPEARARARLMTSVLVAAVGAATVLAVLTVVLVLLGRPGLTLDDPTARHSALGGEPTALLFWFARLTAAVIALAVLAARRARPAERWLRSGLAALVVVVALGGLAVLLATVTETLTGSAVVGWIVAALVVAALWAPVQARTERLAERLLYGTRATPAGVLAEVSELTRRTAADPTGLDLVPEAVGRALGARAVRLTTHREGMSDRTSRWRTPGSGVGEPDASFPVRHEGQEVGALAVDAEALAGGDERRRLVADVADGLGGVLAAHRLEIELERQLRAAVAHAEQIAASRRRLVSEMDSERRGIERNLHDGAQHHLVSLRLTLGLVEHLASAGRLEGAHERLALLLDQLDTAETVLAETASGVSSATLRRLGPVETLRADLAEAEPPIVVDGEGVGRHDEAVEAAVYFSTLEAVNNARKYAGGAPVSVRLREADGVLRAVVRDEGPGFTPTPGQGPGRGMRNLATRLATVSGRVDVESAPGAGTTVRVEVPLPGAAGAATPRPSTPAVTPPAPAAPAPVEVPPEPAPEPLPEPVAVVPRRAAVVPELGPPRRGPDPAGPRAAPPELLPSSGSPLYDASVDLLRAVMARTPDRHPAARPLAALLARHGAPWRVGVAGPDPSDAAAVARALAAAHPGTGTVVDLCARAAAGPIAPEDVVDELVLLARDDAGSSVPGWLADRPTVEVRIVLPGADAADGVDQAARTVRVVLPGPGTPASELERVVEALERDARPRAARSRARAVLDGIEAVARADRDPWGRRVLFDVERVRTAGAQELAEAELAEAVRTGRTVLPGTHRDAAVRLLGGEGTSPTARLGLPADADPEEVGAAAREQRARWQRLAAHLPADRAAREAAEVLVAACEGLISTPGRAAAR
jgi:signal transduction histidine kinase